MPRPKFPKGKSGNPNGRPPLPDDVNQAIRVSKVEFVRLVNKFMGMTKDELKAHIENPATPMMEVFIGQLIGKGAAGGDHVRMEFVLNRLIGRVPIKFNEEGEKNPLDSIAAMADFLLGSK